jgi:hypothetical protein
MDSPTRKSVREEAMLAEHTSYNRRNWEGLLAALGMSALGWATIALVVTYLLR